MTDDIKEKFSPLHSFDWDKAKNFYYIAKLGSFSEAAKFLNASQPNLSRQVSLLEEDLQCRLFSRSVRGVVLTRKGEELFTIVENYYLALKTFNYNHKVMSQNGERRKIRISAPPVITAYLLHDYILEYNEVHPEIMLEIITDEYNIDIAINDIDVAIRPYEPNVRNVCQEHMITLNKRLYASRDYLNKMGIPKSIDDLKAHDFLAYAHQERTPYTTDSRWVLRLGMPTGTMREPKISSNSLEFLVESAKRGFGIIGSYGEISLIRQSGLLALLPDVMGPEIQAYIVYPKHLAKDEIFMNFVQYLHQKVKSLNKY